MFRDVIGHDKIVESLKNAISSGRIANAYIFSGPTELGKEFVAINFAKSLNCSAGKDDSCDECKSCKKIDSGNHPDVRLIKPESAKLKIDQMRFLQKQGNYRAVEGKYKIFIIDEAEKMTPEAANSLLKILEEPPGTMVLILITSMYRTLLPTIRSRCQSVKFSLIPLNVLKDELIKRFAIPESKARLLAIQSQGKVGKAIKFLNMTEDYDKSDFYLSILTNKDTKSLLQVFKRSEDFSKSQDCLEILINWYRDLLLVKQGCSESLILNNDKRDELKKIAQTISDSQIEKLIRLVLRTQNLIQKNINPILAIEVMMLQSFYTISSGQ